MSLEFVKQDLSLSRLQFLNTHFHFQNIQIYMPKTITLASAEMISETI